MPKLPGRKSTAKKVALDKVSVSSFIMQHEEWYWRRVCVIEGCDHRMGPNTSEPRWALEWKPCHEGALPAWVALNADLNECPGIACPCCVAKILDSQRP